MALTKTYTKSPCALDSLIQAIQQDAAITVALDLTTTSLLGNQLTVGFKADLSDWSEVDALVTAHDGVALPQNSTQVVTGTVTVTTTKDSDGTDLTRQKITALGWTIQDHYFEFKLGTLASTGLYSKKADGTAFGFCTMKFYRDVAGVETLITGNDAADQSYLTTNAIRTDVIWEMTNDLDIISGYMAFAAAITVDVRFWVVVVPDLPEIYGGSKELVTGGRNLRFMEPCVPFVIEGRTVKHLVYGGTYHTNKIKLTYRHPAGFNDAISMSIGLYKA